MRLSQMDPYKGKMVPTNVYFEKRAVQCTVAAVMDGSVEKRNLEIIDELTRAFRKSDLIEVILTTEQIDENRRIQAITYFGFLEVCEGGIIKVQDELHWKGRKVGTVIGFDATHFPNHYNLLIQSDVVLSGAEQKLSLEDQLTFSYKREGEI